MSMIQHRHLSLQSGFTLVEMMIVVAIIGILAAIAGVSYQTQIRQTQIMTIYQTINQFRLPYQTLVNEGAGVTAFSPSGLNMPDQTKYCQFTVSSPAVSGTTTNAVTCTIQNLAYLQGETIGLDRATDGSWQCRASVGISRNYLTKDCQ
ncbi:pilin [Psychrobacter immobilis]|uniref:pilin n=1 Tax=Psychrobacter immobilis TaxID=498 RepID=UPI0019194ED2|nr:pilin [Psychrobacter immobilis]